MKGQEKFFYTPPPRLRSNRNSPVMMPPRSANPDLFHVIHKVPAGDSPYVRAKRVQMIDKDPSKAVSLFWAAINSGDRVDSALKDMAIVMKQLDRSEEAIEAIKSFRHLCPPESQDSLDNVLLELYRSSCRFEEEIQLLHSKLNNIEDDFVFSGKRSKICRSQGKKIHIPLEKDYSRLLGNMAWTYLQNNDYKSAELYYRKALSFELDRNRQCNLAICLIHLNKISEAEILLQAVKASHKEGGEMDESSSKSFARASQMLDDLPERRGYCAAPKGGGNMDDEERGSRMLDDLPERRGGRGGGYYCRSFSVAAKPPSNAPGFKLLRKPDMAGAAGASFLESRQQKKKSWADMVEEEDEEHEFADENEDSNIVMQTTTPCSSLHQDEESTKKKSRCLGGLNDEEGYYTQPIHDASQKTNNQAAAKRSLCFDQNQKLETEFSSPLLHKNLDFFGVRGSVSLNNKEEEGGSVHVWRPS